MNYKLDSFKWIKDEDIESSDGLGEPEELITDVLSELKEATDSLEQIYAEFENGNK
jgi:type I restriction enzyme M protein